MEASVGKKKISSSKFKNPLSKKNDTTIFFLYKTSEKTTTYLSSPAPTGLLTVNMFMARSADRQ